MNGRIIAVLIFLFVVWLIFRQMIKEGLADTNFRRLFLLKKK
jgi:hypothetical protein